MFSLYFEDACSGVLTHTKCVYVCVRWHRILCTRFTGLCWLLRQSCPHFVIFIWVMTPIKSTWLVNKFCESRHLLVFTVLAHFGSEKFARVLFPYCCCCSASFLCWIAWWICLKLPLLVKTKHTRPISFCVASSSFAIYMYSFCILYFNTHKYVLNFHILTKFSTLLNFKFTLFIWPLI